MNFMKKLLLFLIFPEEKNLFTKSEIIHSFRIKKPVKLEVKFALSKSQKKRDAKFAASRVGTGAVPYRYSTPLAFIAVNQYMC